MNLLDVALNQIPPAEKPLENMTAEKELDTWLKESDFNAKHVREYKLNTPDHEREFPFQGKSEFSILHLSLENDSTVTRTASILEQFGTEVGIHCGHAHRFSLHLTRKRIFMT